jgi:hypothetical protein
MYKGKNRRQHSRYRAQQLSIQVWQRGSNTPPDRVIGSDFNSHGVAFASAGHEFSEGDQLELTLSLNNIHISNLIGLVRSSHNGRYGIEFDFTSKYMQSKEVIDALDKIEDILNTSHSAVSSGVRKMKKRDRYTDKH